MGVKEQVRDGVSAQGRGKKARKNKTRKEKKALKRQNYTLWSEPTH